MPHRITPVVRYPAYWLGLALLLLMAAGSSITLAQNAVGTTPIGEAVKAGPWQMTIVEVLTGSDGDAAAANAGNPASPDGLNYVAIHVQVQNQATEPFRITPEDFAVVGTSGLVRRAAGVFAPAPELDGIVAGGESLDGWVLSSSEIDPGDLVLLYDSTTITGTWADHAFAITEGAEFQPSQERAAERDRDGRDPGSPVGIGRVIATDEWSIQIVDVVQGAAVNDISPAETQRLGQSYLSGGGTYASCLDTWLAIQIEATNNGGDGITRYLSPTAFQLAAADGAPALDVRTLTPPVPDLSGEYAAGASRTGWISFELPSLCDASGLNLLYDADLLRFQPFWTTTDVRYLTWGDTQAEQADPTATARPFDAEEAIPAGTLVVTTDEGVRIRDEPSIDGAIVDELDEGVELEITGEPVEGDGFTWYPVRNPENDDEGWVVQDFVAAP